MNNENKNNGSLPLIIIGLVLVAGGGGGWWLYQNSQASPTAKSGAAAANANKKDDSSALKLYQNAPPGAQPPNALGSAAAAVTVEEFADFQCPTCAGVYSKMKEINAIYGSRINFIFRSYPLTQIHKNGLDAAIAAEAAGIQGKYWDMQNQLFTNQNAWANSDDARKIFKEYAQKIGLDADKFETDMLGLGAKGRVDLDIARGRAMKINGTPTIFINGKQLAYEQFDVTPIRQVIDAELEKAQGGGGQPPPPPTNNQTQTNAANAENK